MQAGQASATARRVAAQRLGFDRVAAGYGRPDDDQRLQADVADGIDASPSLLTRYLAARTAFVDRAVVGAIAVGIKQIVVAGAGYDGRAWRYAKPGVTWFELDHPATQADKVARVRKLGLGELDVRFVAADFVLDDVAAALLAAGFDPAEPSLSYCEGVLGYLPDEAATALLMGLRRVAAPGGRLAVTLMVTPETDQQIAGRARLAAAVASLGEPLASSIDRAELPAYLAETGWAMHADHGSGTAAFVVATPAASPTPA